MVKYTLSSNRINTLLLVFHLVPKFALFCEADLGNLAPVSSFQRFAAHLTALCLGPYCGNRNGGLFPPERCPLYVPRVPLLYPGMEAASVTVILCRVPAFLTLAAILSIIPRSSIS